MSMSSICSCFACARRIDNEFCGSIAAVAVAMERRETTWSPSHISVAISPTYTAVLREAWATLPKSSSRPLPASLAQSRNLAHASLETAVCIFIDKSWFRNCSSSEATDLSTDAVYHASLYGHDGQDRAANGQVWMSQAFKDPILIQFWSWVIVLFPILATWGNKNWPPSMKVRKL